jgi:hypothetical protein
MTTLQTEAVEALRIQWKKLWQERVDDKVLAEGIAITDYSSLFVQQGTVIHATRDFKALNFKEIIEQHEVENPDRYIQPNQQIGGWKKFVKTQITNQKPRRNTRAQAYVPEKKAAQQCKKGGRGWLHK